MKCPGCKFVCSDLRDLCPKCLLDLRPTKKIMGLPISYPDATRKELLAKVTKKKVSSKKEAVKKKKGGLLGSLFGSEKKKKKKAPEPLTIKSEKAGQAATEKIVEKETEPPVISQEVKTEPITPKADRVLEKEETVTPPPPKVEAKPEEKKPDLVLDLPDLIEEAEQALETELVDDAPDNLDFIPVSDEKDEETQESMEGAEPPAQQEAPAKEVSSPTPEVLDFTDADGDLSDILDNIIGDTEISVEAVEVEKSEEDKKQEAASLNFTVEIEDEDSEEEQDDDDPDDEDGEWEALDLGQEDSASEDDNEIEEELSESKALTAEEKVLIAEEEILNDLPPQIQEEPSSPEELSPVKEELAEVEEEKGPTEEDLEDLSDKMEAAEAQFAFDEIEDLSPEKIEALEKAKDIPVADESEAEAKNAFVSSFLKVHVDPIEETKLPEQKKEEEQFDLTPKARVEKPEAKVEPNQKKSPFQDWSLSDWLKEEEEKESHNSPSKPLIEEPRLQQQETVVSNKEEKALHLFSEAIEDQEPATKQEAKTLVKPVVKAYQEKKEEAPTILDDLGPAQEELAQTQQEDTTPLPTYQPALSELDKQEISELFDTAQQNTADFQSDLDFSITAEHFQNFEDREDVKILFDLAKESIENPEAEKRYVNQVEISRERTVSANLLTKQLDKVKKVIEAPVLSLKKAVPTKLQETYAKRKKTKPSRYGKIQLASPTQRLIAYAVDTLCMVFCATLSASMYICVVNPDLIQTLFSRPELLSAVDYISMLTPLVASLIIWLLVFPIVVLLLLSNLPGLSMLGLEIIRENGRRVKMANICLRSLSFPLSCILLGFLAIILNKRPLHDLLSRTFVCVSQGSTE